MVATRWPLKPQEHNGTDRNDFSRIRLLDRSGHDTAQTMSLENLAIAVRAMEAASAPSPDVATLTELYAPEHVLVPVGAGGIEGEAHGLDGFQTWRANASRRSCDIAYSDRPTAPRASAGVA
jgi:hypothetical protein